MENLCCVLAGWGQTTSKEKWVCLVGEGAAGWGVESCASTHLDEADVLGVLAEALTADVQVVLPDDTPLVRAHAAAQITNNVVWGKGPGATSVFC